MRERSIFPRMAIDALSSDAPPPLPVVEKFRDPSDLANWTAALLSGHILFSLAAIGSGALQWDLLHRVVAGAEVSESELTANDFREGLISIGQLALLMITIVLFCMWTYRSAKNVRALGANHLSFSPGWAVGNYFIPIVSLWRPFLALLEIWKASLNPKDWDSQSAGWLPGVWWVSWIVSNIFSNVSARAVWKAETPSDYILATGVLFVDNSLSIIAAVLAILVVKKISGMQTAAEK